MTSCDGGAGAAALGARELLGAAAVRAGEVERPLVAIDRSEQRALAAAAAALGLAHLRPAAIRTRDRRVPGEEQPLVERPARPAQACLGILRPAAGRARAALQRTRNRFLRVRCRETATSAGASSRALRALTPGTDEVRVRRDRRLLARCEQDESISTLGRRERRMLEVRAGPAGRLVDLAIAGEPAAASVAGAGAREVARFAPPEAFDPHNVTPRRQAPAGARRDVADDGICQSPAMKLEPPQGLVSRSVKPTPCRAGGK